MRPINVTMLGAGSFFTSSILKDVLLIPNNSGGELRLIDIDERRLRLSESLLCKIVEQLPNKDQWHIRAGTNRIELLRSADYIVNAIEVSGLEAVRHDNDIPLEYGISQNIGDTIGPGGIFKALRTIPVWVEILKDIERVCPQALVLNYTNPMNTMCLAAERTTKVQVVGLCHSVQGTSRMLAKYAGIPYEEMKWQCAGINHLAWFTELKDKNGNDLYPILKAQAKDPNSEFKKAEPVRTDMMLHFGAFITESSGHLSEYLPYYRKRRDLLEKYTDTGYRGEESFYANNWPTWRKQQDETRAAQISGREPIKMERSLEYGAHIIEAIEKDTRIEIHGNVPNQGAIENLPEDGCVEVACKVDAKGVQKTNFGRLPKQMAAICDWNMRCFDLGADAAIHKSKELAIQAMMLDPVTSAVCSPAEIREMTLKMFEAEKDLLPGFN